MSYTKYKKYGPYDMGNPNVRCNDVKCNSWPTDIGPVYEEY